MRHALDCGMCCGLQVCDCGAEPKNLYQRVWDGGYAKRSAKILATKASANRKLCALMRVWRRMVR